MSGQKRLAIFERYTEFNEFEESGGEWGELFREWVEIAPLNGRELLDADKVSSQTTHRLRMHWHDDVRSEDRIKVSLPEPVNEQNPNDDANFRILHIESVINLREQNKSLELLAVEKHGN